MVYVYEFEVFQSDGGRFVAWPFDFEGGTQGESLHDVAESAADWLQMEIEHRSLHDHSIPEPTFGNAPRCGGRILLVAVHAGKETVPRMTCAEAARRLGVTRGRVSQLAKAGLLETFELEGRTWVSAYSVEARLAEQPRAGRPRSCSVRASAK